MLDNLKNYLITVGMKKYLPIAAMSAVTALGAFLAAHAGVLESYGITYGNWPLQWPTDQSPSGPCILVELDTLSAVGITAIVGLVAAFLRATEHHAATALQSPTEKPSEGVQK